MDSAQACVHSGKEVYGTLLAIKFQAVPQEDGSGGLRERSLLCVHGRFRRSSGKIPGVVRRPSNSGNKCDG